MRYDFSVIGHGWLKKLMYDDRGSFRELKLPGGGLMLAGLMAKMGISVAAAELDEPERTEMAAAEIVSLPAGGARVLRQIKSLGFTGGNPLIWEDPETDAGAFIVWDEGFWGIGELPVGQPVMWVSRKTLPYPESYLPVRDNCLLLADIEAFRSAGFCIPEGGGRPPVETVRGLIEGESCPPQIRATGVIWVTDGLGAVLVMRRNADGGYVSRIISPMLPDLGREDAETALSAVPDIYTLFVSEVAARFREALSGVDIIEDVLSSDLLRQAALTRGYTVQEKHNMFL